jgi:hypothetical protein
MQPEHVILLRDGMYRYAFAVRYILGHQGLDVSKNLAQLTGEKAQKQRYILGVLNSDISIIDGKEILNFIHHVTLNQT